MLNSVIERHSKINPLSETEIQIVNTAIKLFLEQGFSQTTHRQIAKESGIGLGTITYHYKTKEDLLKVLMEELMDAHLDLIDDSGKDSGDILFSYALEIAMQIALCENNPKAWDLYYAAYSHPPLFEYIKGWASQKNYHLLKEKLPHLSEEDFRRLEHITSGIELAVFTAPCDRYFDLKDKIDLVIESMLKIYEIPKEERDSVLQKIRKTDCEKIAEETFEKFVKRIK